VASPLNNGALGYQLALVDPISRSHSLRILSMLRRTPLDSNEVHTKLVHPTSKMRIIHRFVCDVIDLPDNCHGRTLRHEKGIPRDRFRQARLVRSCEPRE